MHDQITRAYHEAKADGTLAALPPELAPHAEQIFGLIDSVFSECQTAARSSDDRKPKTNPLNANFEKKEFKELWERINRKAVYRVEFDSNELIRNSIRALDKELTRDPAAVHHSGRHANRSAHRSISLRRARPSSCQKAPRKQHTASIHSEVKYDLLGKLAENTQLTRKTLAEILTGIEPTVFNQFRQNPEHFIAETTRLINEQKATVIIERLGYDPIEDELTRYFYRRPE